MRIFLVIILSAVSGIIFSQTINRDGLFCASGYYKKAGYAEISWTLGDVAIIKLTNKNNVMTQGFLQTREGNIDAIGDINPDEYIKIKFYPNPVKDKLKIELSDTNKEQIIFDFYTIEGKKIITQKLQAFQKETEINLQGCKPGIYILRAQYSNGKTAESNQIIVQE